MGDWTGQFQSITGIRDSQSSPNSRACPVFPWNLPPAVPPLVGAERQPRLSLSLLDREVSHRTCISVFLFVVACAILTPFKEYYLGSYVTKPFDEVRDDVVARKLHQLGVLTSGVHYFDTFDHERLPLVDSASPTFSCARTSPQLPFGNWFLSIHHEFCRDFQSRFQRDRFFDSDGQAPVDRNLSSFGKVTLGLVAVIDMSEIYLCHFDDVLVVRKIMKNVQEGYLGLSLPDYTNEVATAILAHYAKGMPLAKVAELLPRSLDDDHIALVDVLGVSHLLPYYLTYLRLTMGVLLSDRPHAVPASSHRGPQ